MLALQSAGFFDAIAWALTKGFWGVVLAVLVFGGIWLWNNPT